MSLFEEYETFSDKSYFLIEKKNKKKKFQLVSWFWTG